MVTQAELRKFMRYVRVQPDGCWMWCGEGTADGYGRFTPAPGKPRALTHQWSYEAHKGPIPEGMDVGHECHDRAVEAGTCPGGPDCKHRRCCNPAHLAAQTRSENTLAQNHYERARTHCPRGHEYTPENTANRNGRRFCRTCDRERKRVSR